MNDKVVRLDRVAREPDPDLVERVESLLAMAKSGDLLSLQCAGLLACNEFLTSFGPSPDVVSDLGALEVLKARLISKSFDYE